MHLGFETLIGKATGQFSETNYNVNINATDLKEREKERKRLKELNEKRITDKNLLKSNLLHLNYTSNWKYITI